MTACLRGLGRSAGAGVIVDDLFVISRSHNHGLIVPDLRRSRVVDRDRLLIRRVRHVRIFLRGVKIGSRMAFPCGTGRELRSAPAHDGVYGSLFIPPGSGSLIDDPVLLGYSVVMDCLVHRAPGMRMSGSRRRSHGRRRRCRSSHRCRSWCRGRRHRRRGSGRRCRRRNRNHSRRGRRFMRGRRNGRLCRRRGAGRSSGL